MIGAAHLASMTATAQCGASASTPISTKDHRFGTGRVRAAAPLSARRSASLASSSRSFAAKTRPSARARARGDVAEGIKGVTTRAVFDPDSVEDPLLRQALKEPVAFFGGMFAGALGLSTTDEPLKAWVEKTSEAAGVRVVGGRLVVEDRTGEAGDVATEAPAQVTSAKEKEEVEEEKEEEMEKR